MKNKGLMLLDCVKDEILPQITEIISTQEKIELINEEGDSIIGYVDLIAKIKGIEEPVILDFKTSGKRYKLDSVETSTQLALYVYSLLEKYKTRKAGFIVLGKKLKDVTIEKTCKTCANNGLGRSHRLCDAIIEGKRCNGEWDIKTARKVDTQFLINDIPNQMERSVLEEFNEINRLIKNGVFEKKLESCKKHYGKLTVTCPYFDKCFNNSDKGLVKV